MMNARSPLSLRVLAALAVLAVPLGAAAITKDQAIENLKKLQPRLTQLKSQGTVGEVYDGTIAAVKSVDKKTQQFIAEVNTNRQVIYRAVAEQHGITPQQAGILAGRRNFREAAKGEYLKDRKGQWHRKK